MNHAFAQSARAFWNERNARERGMLAAAATVVVLGLVYVLLLDPALNQRAQLEQQLPALRQQAAEVRALTREAGAAGARASAPVPAVTRASLDASLARRGLKAQEITVSGEVARVRFDNASFADLVDWLADMHRSARLAVAEAKIEAGGQGQDGSQAEGQSAAQAANQLDRVSAAFTLRQQRGGQAE
jgi:general secretion pathway protein M